MTNEARFESTFDEFERAAWRDVADGYAQHWRSLTRQAAAPLLDAAGVTAHTNVLDIATGPGDVALAADKRHAHVAAIDFSDEMIRIARSVSSSVQFEKGDAHELQFPDGSFDAVTMNFGIRHLNNPEQAIGEAARVLKPGGRFAFTDWASPDEAKGFGLVRDAVTAFGQPVQFPGPLMSPSFADSEVATRTLQENGFESAESTVLPMAWSLASIDDIYEAFAGGTARTGASLRLQAPKAKVRIADAIAANAAPFIVNGQILIPMPAVMCVGTKPA